MKRTYYFIVVSALAALMFIVLVQSNGIIKPSDAGVPSQSSAAKPAAAPDPEPDALSKAIDDLASWPIEATRK